MIDSNHHFKIRLNERKIRSLVTDYSKSAAAVNLVYVNDKQEGITRLKKGQDFIYVMGEKQVSDESVLSRIKNLVIPPAWAQVWICVLAEGHIQATGLDANGRKQYKYHPFWNVLRTETKFVHLYDFGLSLKDIRKQITADLALPGLPLRKVLAALVSIMEHTGIRVGNNAYEKLYGSFGLTTLKDKHVAINGSDVKFSFKGKKGVWQNIKLKSRKLARIVRQCRDIPGKELFQYYDENGLRKPIDSGMVNSYIEDICGKHFTAKDFRTWAGTLYAFEAFRQLGCCESISETKRKINEALKITAQRLGNTVNVCRKYYVHPAVINNYIDRSIEKYFDSPIDNSDRGLTTEEQMLMKMLAQKDKTVIDLTEVAC